MPDSNTICAITAQCGRVADISRVVAQSRSLIPPVMLGGLGL